MSNQPPTDYPARKLSRLPMLTWDYRMEIRGGETFTGQVAGTDIRYAFENAIEKHDCAGIDVALFHAAEGC
jgi:hypothetical protein